jgi:hypothetical protein
LIDVGLLALVAASAAVARNLAASRGTSHALELASGRIERALATSCAGAAAATSTLSEGIVEHWSDAPSPNGTRVLSESLTVATPSGARAVVLHTAGAC